MLDDEISVVVVHEHSRTLRSGGDRLALGALQLDEIVDGPVVRDAVDPPEHLLVDEERERLATASPRDPNQVLCSCGGGGGGGLRNDLGTPPVVVVVVVTAVVVVVVAVVITIVIGGARATTDKEATPALRLHSRQRDSQHNPGAP